MLQWVEWENEHPSRHTPHRFSRLPLEVFERCARLQPLRRLCAPPKSARQFLFCARTRLPCVEVALRGTDQLTDLLWAFAEHAEQLVHLRRLVLRAPEADFAPAEGTELCRALPPGFRLAVHRPWLLILERDEQQC